MNLPVKKISKSVKIWQNCGYESVALYSSGDLLANRDKHTETLVAREWVHCSGTPCTMHSFSLDARRHGHGATITTQQGR